MAAAHPPPYPFAPLRDLRELRERNPPDFSHREHREHREHRAHREKPAVLSEEGGGPAAAPGAERARGDVALPAGGTTLRQAEGRRLTPLPTPLLLSVISVSSVREIPRTFLTESTESTEHTERNQLCFLRRGAARGRPGSGTRPGRRRPPGGRNDVTPSRMAAARPPPYPFAPLRDLRELRERKSPDFSHREHREHRERETSPERETRRVAGGHTLGFGPPPTRRTGWKRCFGSI
jgi:hypothetical protein